MFAATLPASIVGMDCEIGMDVEEAASGRLVKASALKRRIWDQVVNAKELTYELYEPRRIELVEYALQCGSPRTRIGVAEFSLVDVEVVVPPFGVERWELGNRSFHSRRLEEVVEDDVRIRFGGLVVGM